MGFVRHRWWCIAHPISLTVILALCSLSESQLPFSYNVTSFNNETLKDWNVMTVWQSYKLEKPNPQIINPNEEGVLSLTTSTGDYVQAGLAVLNKQVPWGQGFDVYFQFRLYNAGVSRPRLNATQYDGTNPDVGGDGITFAIFSTLPKFAGKYGGGLGYYLGDEEATRQSVAIEFDTWNNPEYFDPVNEGGIVGGDTNHIGINLGGLVVSEKTVHVKTPFNDGGLKNVWISYFAADKMLQVFYNDTGFDRPTYPTFTFERDLEQALGVGTQNVFVGFTAGSASAFENQTITVFTVRTLNGTERPAPAVQPGLLPEDPTLLLLRESVNFTDFNTDSWVPVGSAAPLKAGPMQLTRTKDVELNEAFQPLADPGQATLQEAQDCTVGCSVYAAFAITNDVRLIDQSDLVPGGDGFAILLTDTPSIVMGENIPGGLGYNGNDKSVAVEVDTWFDLNTDPENPKNPDGSLQLAGPDGNHIGVNLNGNPQSIATVHLPSPANDNQVNTPNYNLRIKHIWVDVDNVNKIIRVFYNEVANTKPVSPVLSTPLNISDVIGSTSLYLSFTAATSRGLSNHYIIAASFSAAQTVLNTQGNNTYPTPFASMHSFDTSTSRAFFPDGGASIVATDSGSLLLTNSSVTQPTAGMLAFIAPLNISNGVQIKICFQITASDEGEDDPSDGSTARDGLALVLLGYETQVAGAPGNGLGYGGLLKSVAVEIDTFYNPEWDPLNDGNHIGINLEGNMTSAMTANIPEDMGDGGKKYLWLDCDVEDKVCRVYYNYRDSKPLSPVLTYPINLLAALGTPAPHLIITAGSNGTTGGATQHELCSLSINNTKPTPPQAINITTFDAASMRMLAMGGAVAGLGSTADGKLQLSSAVNRGQQVSLVRSVKRVDISEGASVYMQIVMDGRNATVDPADKWGGRDGVAFVFLGTNDTTPSTEASGLGYGGRNDSVAVEMDIWFDPAYERVNDGNHIAINVKGDLASLTAIKIKGNMADGQIKNLWVDYNNVDRLLSVYYNPMNATKPGTPTLTHTVDIPYILESNDVYVGVTSGTDSGNLTATVMQLAAFSVSSGLPEVTELRAFSNFSSPEAKQALVGGAGTTRSGSLYLTNLTMTDFQSVGAVLKDPVVITQGFSAYMEVVLTPGGIYDEVDNSTGPNGVALALLPRFKLSGDISAAVGDGLGYSGLPNTVAVELDTVYTDTWDPVLENGQGDGNHVGINLNGNLKSIASAHLPRNLADGVSKHVWIDYDNMEKSMQVFLNSAPVKPLDPVLMASVDAESVLGTNTPFIAVTSGTANPGGPAVLVEFSVQPGRPEALDSMYAGPNSIYRVDAQKLATLTRSGSTALLGPNPDGSVPLTDPSVTTPQASLVILPESVNYTNGMNSHFQIRMTSPADAVVDPADGFQGTGGAAIILLPNNQVVAGDPDSGLGYGGMAGSSVAVEIDKWFDSSTDPVNPITDGTLQVRGADGNHIGIDQDGMMLSTSTAHIPRDFNSPLPNNIWIDYNPNPGQLYVYFNGPNATKPARPMISAPIDLVSKLNTPYLYVGISAGTAGASTKIDLVRCQVVAAMPKIPPASADMDVTFIGDLNRTSVQSISVLGAVDDVPQPDFSGGLRLVDQSTLTAQSSILLLSSTVDLSRGFRGKFQFVFTSNNASDDVDPADNWTGRDGAAIVFLGAGYLATGAPGGGLGYGGLNKSIAIELDSWYDSWDPVSDAGIPDGNHVGVNTNGDLNSLASASLPLNLNNGNPKNLWVDIDSISKTMYVYCDESDFKPETALLAVPLDVVGVLGTEKPALVVTSGAQGKNSVTGEVLRMAEFSSQQPQAALAAAVKPLPLAKTLNLPVKANSFSLFNAETIQAFQLSGSVTTTAPDSNLQLTDPAVSTPQASMALYRDRMDASTGFSVYLRCRINTTDTAATDPDDGFRGRDGMAVVLLGGNDTVQGQPSSGLGYGGLQKSIAVELDTWQNAEFKDPNGNHVGINLGGNLTSVASARIGTDLTGPQDNHLWVDYDNVEQMMTVYFSNDGTKPATPLLAYGVNVPFTVGTSMPYVGVSAGTTNAAAAHIVKVLSFKSGVQPPNSHTREFDDFTSDVIESSFQTAGAAVVDPYQPGTMALTTDDPSTQAGVIALRQNVNFTLGVSIFMQFQMNNTARAVSDSTGGIPGGDGMVLMLTGAGRVDPGEGGQGMGYKDMKSKSIAMELDTFFNSAVDPQNPKEPWGASQYNGSDGNHMGLNLHGSTRSIATKHITPDFNDGAVHSVWMDCDNTGKVVHMYHNPMNASKPPLPSLSVTLEDLLSNVLQTTSPVVAVSAGSTNGATVHRLRALSVTEGAVPNPYSFPSAYGSGWSAWALSGTARVPEDSDGGLQLTAAGGVNQIGRAVLPTPLNMTRGLSLQFVVDIKAAAGRQAKDGVAVALVPSAQLPAPAGYIGYDSLKKSVIVELDTFFTDGVDPKGGRVYPANNTGSKFEGDDGNHVGINVNGQQRSVAAVHVTDPLADGQPNYVWLDYDNVARNLAVYISTNGLKPASPALVHRIDIQRTLGTAWPYVVITAGSPDGSSTITARAMQMEVGRPGQRNYHAAGKSKGLSKAAVAGIVIAVLLFALLVAILLWWVLCRFRCCAAYYNYFYRKPRAVEPMYVV